MRAITRFPIYAGANRTASNRPHGGLHSLLFQGCGRPPPDFRDYVERDGVEIEGKDILLTCC
jgi:hypothetical protein